MDLKKDLEWSICFKSDYIAGILYNAIRNIYLALILGFVSQIVTINNQKLHIATFCKLFYLTSSFGLLSSNKVQSHLPVFYKPLLNPRKLLALILHDLNASSTPCTLSFFYHMPAEIEAMDNTIAAAPSTFEKKASEVENKCLRYHAQMFAKDLDPLGVAYLRKHKLMSNAPVIQSLKLACVIINHFNILPPPAKLK